jgi:hypothetical protein
MWKYDNYYYYSFGLNVAGGEKVMRSQTLTADETAWEIMGDFFNMNDPKKGGSLFTTPNHNSASVLINDSTSWVIHPVYAKDEWKGQGRQGLLNQVRYAANGKPVADYPINESFIAPALPGSGIPWMVPKSDFFESEELNPEWSYLGYTVTNKLSLTDRPGWLRLSAKSATKANTIIKNDGEHNYSLIIRFDFKPASTNDEAGLWIMRGDEQMQVKLVSTVSTDGNMAIVFSFKDTKYELPNLAGDTLWLKMERINHKISAYYGKKGTDWVKVGEDFTISEIDSYSDFSTWIGTRQGLYVKGTKDAFFDLYIYRDAFSPILAECPANQFGTTRGSLKDGIRILDNIHNNDWALFAGVEFGNGEYYDLPDSVAFTASSATSGGIIEVWLDSIDTGAKISECVIKSTASWSEFKTFKAEAGNVSGIHDVYLKFIGAGKDRLFQLKWMKFTRDSDQITSLGTIKRSDEIRIYPNPANNYLKINWEPGFNSINIFNIQGQSILIKNYPTLMRYTTETFDLSPGLYLVMLSNENNSATTKLMIE